MRGSPPCQVALCHFGIWRVSLVALGVAVLATLGAWGVLAPEGPAFSWLVGAALLGALLALAVCVSLWRPSAGVLRWDGAGWSFAAASPAGPAIPGRLMLRVDLGAFMLLRFVPQMRSKGCRALWLPAQRRGLEREWHSFRCAVYSPRPAAAIPGTDPSAP
ncbi:MAG: hypothetical protein M3Z29_09900 [Pseudomonadota bacterium]|nr:hypothetical protein [Pseudomonadota bacterium]